MIENLNMILVRFPSKIKDVEKTGKLTAGNASDIAVLTNTPISISISTLVIFEFNCSTRKMSREPLL